MKASVTHLVSIVSSIVALIGIGVLARTRRFSWNLKAALNSSEKRRKQEALKFIASNRRIDLIPPVATLLADSDVYAEAASALDKLAPQWHQSHAIIILPPIINHLVLIDGMLNVLQKTASQPPQFLSSHAMFLLRQLVVVRSEDGVATIERLLASQSNWMQSAMFQALCEANHPRALSLLIDFLIVSDVAAAEWSRGFNYLNRLVESGTCGDLTSEPSVSKRLNSIQLMRKNALIASEKQCREREVQARERRFKDAQEAWTKAINTGQKERAERAIDTMYENGNLAAMRGEILEAYQHGCISQEYAILATKGEQTLERSSLRFRAVADGAFLNFHTSRALDLLLEVEPERDSHAITALIGHLNTSKRHLLTTDVVALLERVFKKDPVWVGEHALRDICNLGNVWQPIDRSGPRPGDMDWTEDREVDLSRIKSLASKELKRRASSVSQRKE